MDGRKTARLTESGKAYVGRAVPRSAPRSPTSRSAVGDEARELRHQIGALIAAVHPCHGGTPEQVRPAREILIEARQSLYRILADDAPAPGKDTARVVAEPSQHHHVDPRRPVQVDACPSDPPWPAPLWLRTSRSRRCRR